MRPRHWAWVAVLVGCRATKVTDSGAEPANPIPDAVDAVADADVDADTDTDTDTDTDVDSETGTVPFTPVAIELMSVVCDGTVAEYVLYTTGRPAYAMVFSQGTATVEPQWADTHDLESFESDPGGAWDHLYVRLNDGSSLANPEADWVRNESTAFTCEEDYGHFAMGFAFAAFYDDGSIADCLVYGNNSQAVLYGSFERVAEPDFDMYGCAIGSGVGFQ
jgi:hypothetical protein